MARLRTVQFGAVKLNTPVLFASYRIGDYPKAGLKFHPWAITNTSALLINAFDLLANTRTAGLTKEIRNHPNKLHGFIDFDGPIILDSGAFNFIQNPQISITPEKVLEIGLELQPDISVVLDHPFPPKASIEEILSRGHNTQRNSKIMYDKLFEYSTQNTIGNFQLMPVIHGHDSFTIERSLNDIRKIWGEIPPFVGIGSLAPLAQSGNKRTAIDVLITVRRLLPDTHLHCFSLGSALLMLFAFYCGIDSVDSQTWIMSAAFKQAQMPGFHITRLSSREHEKLAGKYDEIKLSFATHLLQLIENESFTVKDWDNDAICSITSINDALEYVEYLEDKEGDNRIHRRACHNLYSFNFETDQVRKQICNGKLEEFIFGRLKSTVYKKAFDHAVQSMGMTVNQ